MNDLLLFTLIRNPYTVLYFNKKTSRELSSRHAGFCDLSVRSQGVASLITQYVLHLLSAYGAVCHQYLHLRHVNSDHFIEVHQFALIAIFLLEIMIPRFSQPHLSTLTFAWKIVILPSLALRFPNHSFCTVCYHSLFRFPLSPIIPFFHSIGSLLI